MHFHFEIPQGLIFFLWIFLSVFWGIVATACKENKGYSKENWFWWGFFFHIAVVLVILSKPWVTSEQKLTTPDDCNSESHNVENA